MLRKGKKLYGVLQVGKINTILACGSTCGHSLPPMFFFKRNLSLELMKGAPPEMLFTGTKCGDSAFFKWIQFFVAQVPPQRPVLFLYNGHISYITSEIIDYAVLHEIMMICLPAYANHLLQPLDVVV